MNPHNTETGTHTFSSYKTRSKRIISNQLTVGLVIILIGSAIMLRKMGAPLPGWLFGWEMILITVGVVIGINSRFRDLSWLIPIIIGLIFLSDDFVPHLQIKKFLWPAGIIAVGSIIALQPFFIRNRNRKHMNNHPEITQNVYDEAESVVSAEDVLDATAIFGGVKRSIVSKRFRGGEVVSVFGGSEINLTHADFEGIIKIEVVNVFGGTKLVVPANWDVQSNMVAILGGVDDKRMINPASIEGSKKVIIDGVSLFGGLDIRSY